MAILFVELGKQNHVDFFIKVRRLKGNFDILKLEL